MKNNIFSNNRSLNVLTQNICSISCNMTNFEILLQRTEVSWDVLVLTECWLPKTYNIPTLNNYVHATTSTNSTQNEGVVIYLRDHLKRTFEEPQIDDCNCLLLKLTTKPASLESTGRQATKTLATLLTPWTLCLLDYQISKIFFFVVISTLISHLTARTDTVTST